MITNRDKLDAFRADFVTVFDDITVTLPTVKTASALRSRPWCVDQIWPFP